jgi:hypothetical protein
MLGAQGWGQKFIFIQVSLEINNCTQKIRGEISWKTGGDDIKMGLTEISCVDVSRTVCPRASTLSSLNIL